MKKPDRVRIPKAAMPVARALRRDVKRPAKARLRSRFYDAAPRFFDGDNCPMGRHPKSSVAAPLRGYQFAGGEVGNAAVRTFAFWWDSLTIVEARAAIDLIWPKKGRRK